MIGYKTVLRIKIYAKISNQLTYYLVNATKSVNLVCLAELTNVCDHEVSDHETRWKSTLVNSSGNNSNEMLNDQET